MSAIRKICMEKEKGVILIPVWLLLYEYRAELYYPVFPHFTFGHIKA
jgi:hypothetical protein